MVIGVTGFRLDSLLTADCPPPLTNRKYSFGGPAEAFRSHNSEGGLTATV
jgi:hypothetical protein